MDQSDNQLLHGALRYAELGYAVFPCRPGTKYPLTEHGFHDATRDPQQVESWWSDWPNANVGIATAGLLVIDVERSETDWLTSQPQRALDLAVAPLSLTAHGGRHYLFRQPAGTSWRCTVRKISGHVDTRTDGGYIVAPPSILEGGLTYRWAEGMELDVGPEELPEPPAWLVERLEGATRERDSARLGSADDANTIPDGQRNNALASLGGSMRRRGMTKAEILSALRQANVDRCVPPLDRDEVEKIAESVARYEPDQVAVAMVEGHWQQMIERSVAARGLAPVALADLVSCFPALRQPVIHGLLRQGETMNVISAPKIGKSWLVTDLALAVATGRPWLDIFATERGDVLIIDNELHGETSANRIPKVAEARGVRLEDIGQKLFVQNLRGHLLDIFTLGSYFGSLDPGRFKVIILDAFYRFMPMDTDENDNGRMASLYNQLDSYADRLGCSFVLIHHTSKGNQSGKSITDVGAGAGSQSRATDTHLVLRPHEEEDAVVLDAAVRSWAPVMPRCLRWTFPVWEPADELDPLALRGEQPRRKAMAPQPTWNIDRFIEAFVSDEPRALEAILVAANAQGINDWQARKFLRAAEASERVYAHSAGRGRLAYATRAQAMHDGAITARTDSKSVQVVALLREAPDLTNSQIAERCGVSDRYVRRIRAEM